jgi:hypothetical protein
MHSHTYQKQHCYAVELKKYTHAQSNTRTMACMSPSRHAVCSASVPCTDLCAGSTMSLWMNSSAMSAVGGRRKEGVVGVS